jgi:hypothetical protein
MTTDTVRSSASPAKPGCSGGWVRRPHRLQSRSASLHATERGFPALLELRSDQAIVGE